MLPLRENKPVELHAGPNQQLLPSPTSCLNVFLSQDIGLLCYHRTVADTTTLFHFILNEMESLEPKAEYGRIAFDIFALVSFFANSFSSLPLTDS